MSKTHMCPVAACDVYGDRGDVCGWHGELIPIPTRVDTKLSNPKDVIGSDKLPLHLVPEVVTVIGCLGFLEGALKYGRFNWRIAGVRFSIYLDAIERHYTKLRAGEWEDQKTKIPHLASIIACCGIILDAKLCGKLEDDRAPSIPISVLIDQMSNDVKRLKALFADHHPKQYTIDDTDRSLFDGHQGTERGVLPQVPRDGEGQEATSDAQCSTP